MSVNANYYVIAGYDLTDAVTDKFEDWKWTDEGEQFLCYQFKDRVQLFDDPMCGYYVYLGHILAAGDEYEFKTVKFDLQDVVKVSGNVNSALLKLIDLGVVDKEKNFMSDYKIITFVEYR